MKNKLLISVIISSLFTVILPAKALETRCGWLANPTPANWFLKDRDGTWTLSAQGGYQTTGMENIPDISGLEYVKTNGYHGYACACLEVDTDSDKMRITHVHNAEQLSLSVCQQDQNLSPW